MGSPVLKSEGIRKLLAKNVRAMLAIQGWSENELARRSNVSQKQINNICMERTGCGIDALDSIAHALALETWQLLSPYLTKTDGAPQRNARILAAYVSADAKTRATVDALLKPKK